MKVRVIGIVLLIVFSVGGCGAPGASVPQYQRTAIPHIIEQKTFALQRINDLEAKGNISHSQAESLRDLEETQAETQIESVVNLGGDEAAVRRHNEGEWDAYDYRESMRRFSTEHQ